MSSLTPVTVTVWGVLQLVLEKLRVSLLKEFSVASFPVVAMVTFEVGSASRTTVYVEEPPPSVVRRFPDPSVVIN